jgi:transglutaminase-like putative cysteine protease
MARGISERQASSRFALVGMISLLGRWASAADITEVQVMTTRTDTMQDYIAATRLCDSDNPWLREKSRQIVDGASNPEEKALRIFHYVRDNVRFSLAYSRSRASSTLKRGYGECGNKTNAQTALLRAVGIPARFRWVQAKTEVLHHLIQDFVYKRMPPVASHFWCECHLDGKWVSCELLLDKLLYDDAIRGLQTSEEGIPPLWVEWIIAPVFYRLNLRNSDRIRHW